MVRGRNHRGIRGTSNPLHARARERGLSGVVWNEIGGIPCGRILRDSERPETHLGLSLNRGIVSGRFPPINRQWLLGLILPLARA